MPSPAKRKLSEQPIAESVLDRDRFPLLRSGLDEPDVTERNPTVGIDTLAKKVGGILHAGLGPNAEKSLLKEFRFFRKVDRDADQYGGACFETDIDFSTCCTHTICQIEKYRESDTEPFRFQELECVYDSSQTPAGRAYVDGSFTGDLNPCKFVKGGSLEAQVANIPILYPTKTDNAAGTIVQYTINGQIFLYKAAANGGPFPAPTDPQGAGTADWLPVAKATLGLTQYHTLGFLQNVLATSPDFIPGLRYDTVGDWNGSGDPDQVVYVRAATATTFEGFGELLKGGVRSLVEVDVAAGTAFPVRTAPAFADLEGAPEDNAALATALAAKWGAVIETVLRFPFVDGQINRADMGKCLLFQAPKPLTLALPDVGLTDAGQVIAVTRGDGSGGGGNLTFTAPGMISFTLSRIGHTALVAAVRQKRGTPYNDTVCTWVPLAEFGAVDNGTFATKADLVNGLVPASQLPSYVDDVLEFATLTALPATGEAGKIYVVQDTNKQFRWGGSQYVEISKSMPLYTGTGQNVDGPMTQKATTDAIIALGGRNRGPIAPSTAYQVNDIIYLLGDKFYVTAAFTTGTNVTSSTILLNLIYNGKVNIFNYPQDALYPYLMPRMDREDVVNIPIGTDATHPYAVAYPTGAAGSIFANTRVQNPTFRLCKGGFANLGLDPFNSPPPEGARDRRLVGLRVPPTEPAVTVYALGYAAGAAPTIVNGAGQTVTVASGIDGNAGLLLQPGDWAILAPDIPANAGATDATPTAYYTVVMRGNTKGTAAQGGGTSTSYTDEQAQDAFAALLAQGVQSGISFVYDDAGNKLNVTVSGGSGGTSTGTDYANPVVLNAAATLAGNTAYYVTGSGYTLTLPPASDNVGKVIFILIASTATGLYPVVGGGSLTMYAAETMNLRATADGWKQTGGQLLPMSVRLETILSQQDTIPISVVWQVPLSNQVELNGPAGLQNGPTIVTQRKGRGTLSGGVGLKSSQNAPVFYVIRRRRNGTEKYIMQAAVIKFPNGFPSSDVAQVAFSLPVVVEAGDVYDLALYVEGPFSLRGGNSGSECVLAYLETV